MMKTVLKLLFLLLCCTSLHAQSNEVKNITAMLDKQLESWNMGDIDGFMRSYWNNDSVMYIGKSGVTYGYNNILEKYKKGFPDTSSMGKLSFDILQLKEISPENYFVLGKYTVTRNKGVLQGHFTLIVKKINGQWVIVSDHSS
jgi:hypothetical protein